MAENPLVHIPRAWPVLNKANALRRQLVGQLRSFDVIRWEGTPYGTAPRQTLQIHELNDLCPRDGWPAVLLVHGGGWQEGSHAHFAHLAPLFAKRGIMAFSMNYRLAPEHRWPAQLEDIELALDFMRSQQIDLQRIAIWGHSAGGQMALMLGLKHPDLIRCMVVSGSPTDLQLCEEQLWLPNFDAAQLKSASPLHQEASALPKTLLLHGREDRVVSPSHSVTFQQKWSEQSEIWLLKNGDHGLRWPLLQGWRLKKRALKWLEQQLDMPSRGSKWKRRKKK